MIPPHLFGLPPAVVRMKARRERDEAQAFMRATVEKMQANGRALDVALSRLVSMQPDDDRPMPGMQ